MTLLHAYDFLASPPSDIPSVTVIAGSDSGLRGWTVSKLNQHEDLTTHDGEVARWKDVRDDLDTASLFSFGEARRVIVRSADKLVKDSRAELEQYVADTGHSSQLVLEVESLPSNTRLFKSVTKDHLLVQCSVPTVGAGRTPRPDLAKIRPFVAEHLAPKHACKITAGGIDALIELLGTDSCMLDSEIARLAVHLPRNGTINETLVREVTLGWRGKSIWDTSDAAAGGQAAEALKHLEKLMIGGERPIALLPQLSWGLRRLGTAMAAFEAKEAEGARVQLREALTTIGFKGGPQDFAKAEAQLKQLGRQRAGKLLDWLLETDLKLKGSHSQDGPDRWAMEELIFKMNRLQDGGRQTPA